MHTLQPFDWREVPFVRLLLPLLLGFISSDWQAFNPEQATACILFCILLQQLYQRSALRSRWRWRYVPGLLFFTAILLLGNSLPAWRDSGKRPDHIRHFIRDDPPQEWLLVRATEPAEQKRKSVKLIAETRWLKHANGISNVSGQVLLYLKADSLTILPEPGDLLWIQNLLQPPQQPMNPGAFDYRRYLYQQQLYLQAYLPEGSWRLAGRDKSVRLKDMALQLRSRAIRELQLYLGKGPESGLAAALIFGYRGELPPELVQAYANSGAIHVLAVSGLHTGILYMLLQLVFKPLRRIRRFRWLPPILVIAGLWGYALVAGLPPSVNRAATMCSMMVIAGELRRKTLVYNTLAATAFVLLILVPGWLSHVGFQLSFLAVLGIVFLQKRLAQLWVPRNKILDYLWQLSAVSIAAQLFTMPLGLYYFHQFPTYFWLSNWLVIPLATVLLGGGLLLLVISPWHLGAKWLGIGLHWLIYWQNKLIQEIDSLPGAVWSGWWLSPWALFLLFMVITGFGLWLVVAKKWGLQVGLAAGVLLCLVAAHQQWKWGQQRQFTLYHLPKRTVFSVFEGRNGRWFGLKQADDARFLQQPHALLAGIQNNGLLVVDSSRGLLQFGHVKIWAINRFNSHFLQYDIPFKTDFVLLSQQPRIDTSGLKERLHTKAILLDGSNSRYYCNKTVPMLQAAGFRVRTTWNEGAIILPL